MSCMNHSTFVTDCNKTIVELDAMEIAQIDGGRAIGAVSSDAVFGVGGAFAVAAILAPETAGASLVAFAGGFMMGWAVQK